MSTHETVEKLSEKISVLEDETAKLVNYFVLVQRLYSATDRADAFAAIHEIVANLVGCEQVAIFELSNDERTLRLVFANAVDEEALRSIDVGKGLIGLAARRAEVILRDSVASSVAVAPYEQSLTACIPMILGQRVTGVVALFRLLPQKPHLVAFDAPIFDAIKTHAGVALYVATTFPRAPARAATRE